MDSISYVLSSGNWFPLLSVKNIMAECLRPNSASLVTWSFHEDLVQNGTSGKLDLSSGGQGIVAGGSSITSVDSGGNRVAFRDGAVYSNEVHPDMKDAPPISPVLAPRGPFKPESRIL